MMPVKTHWVVLGVLLGFFLGGCASAPPEPGRALTAPETDAWIQRLEDTNRELTTLKGLGRLVLSKGDSQQPAARVALMARRPNHVRVDLLEGGLPVGSLAADGSRGYLRDNAQARIHSWETRDASLRRALKLHLKVAETLDLLAGRLPALTYDAAQAYASEDAGSVRLVFRKRWQGVRAVAVVDARSALLREVEMHGGAGLRYRALLGERRSVGPYQMPRWVSFTAGDRGCRLQLDRLWVDMPVKPEAFVLKPPP